MNEFTLDDCKWLFHGASPSSSASARSFSSIFHQVDTLPTADDVSSIFHLCDTHPSASEPCVGFEEWMQRAQEAADSFICDDLIFEDKLPPQLNGTLESELLGKDLPPPKTPLAALEYFPQPAAAINAARSSSITSNPEEGSFPSTFITNANSLDLKNIIVKKPILDKAVESLGGGTKGAQRLWEFIQVWLKHRNISSSMKLPFLSNIAANTAGAAAAQPISPEKILFHGSNGHLESAAFSDVIGPVMSAVPTSSPIIIPDESQVLGTTATALAACELPTLRSTATSSATAASFRAARRRRMAYKRRYLSLHQARSASSLRLGVSSLEEAGACHDSYQYDAYSFVHH